MNMGLDGDLGKYWYQHVTVHILYQYERNGKNRLLPVWEFSKCRKRVVYKGGLLHPFQWKILYTLLTKEFQKHSARWTTIYKSFDREINFHHTHIPTDFNGTAHKFMVMHTLGRFAGSMLISRHSSRTHSKQIINVFKLCLNLNVLFFANEPT